MSSRLLVSSYQGYHSPDNYKNFCRTKLQQICRTNANLLIQILRERHVWKINYSINKAQLHCWAATIKFPRLHIFPDLSLTLGLFPDISQIPWHFQVSRNSRKVVTCMRAFAVANPSSCNSLPTNTAKQWRIQTFWKGGRQCISPVVICHKCERTQRITCLIWEKAAYWKQLLSQRGRRAAPPVYGDNLPPPEITTPVKTAPGENLSRSSAYLGEFPPVT